MIGLGLGLPVFRGVNTTDVVGSFLFTTGNAQGLSVTQAASMFYEGQSGYMQWAAPNEPRFTWDAKTGQVGPIGIELWDARTNALTNNNSFGDDWITNNRVYYSYDLNVKNPFNENGAWFFGCASSGADQTHIGLLSTNHPTNADMVMQVYIRPNSETGVQYTYLRMQHGGDPFNDIRVRMIDAGSITIQTSTSISGVGVEQRHDGWYFLWMAFNTNVSTIMSYHIYLAEPGSGDRAWSVASEDLGFHVFAPQLVFGTEPVRAGRLEGQWDAAADLVSIKSLAMGAEGQFIMDFQKRDQFPTGRATALFVTNSAIDNTLAVYVNSAPVIGVEVQSGGTDIATDTASFAALGRHRVAVAYQANSFAAHIAQTLVMSDNAGPVPTFHQVHLGGEEDGANPLNGYIRQLVVKNDRPTNAVNSGASAQ